VAIEPQKRHSARGKANDVPSAYGGDEREGANEARAPSPLDAAPGQPGESNRLAFEPAQIGEIPQEPGVYLMRDPLGQVLYVGKSVQLRTRVRSYFQEGADGRINARFLQRRIATVEIFTTRNEKEALLLENALIKRHAPRYNLRLTDDKSYYSIKLDLRARFPRLEFVRTHNLRPERGKQVEYFGPYHSSDAVRSTIGLLQKLFPLRTCTDHVMNNRTRPCLLHEVGKCCAPCVLPVAPEEYQKLLRGAQQFLGGRAEETLRDLRLRMHEAAEAMRYEDAARLRDAVQAVERTMEQQDVSRLGSVARDVLAFKRQAGTLCLVVLHYRDQGVVEAEHFIERDTGEDDAHVMGQVVARYYGAGRTVPPEVWTACEAEGAAGLRDWLSTLLPEGTRAKAKLLAPERGPKAQALELAVIQAERMLEKHLAGERSREEVLESLQRKLGLPRAPRHIECFDISTHQGSANVAAMVCFRDGDPDKSSYRRFRIRALAEGEANDFESMREVLTRRYRRLIDEGSELPDLVIVDGGKGQLSIAVSVFVELGIIDRVPLAGMAKSRLKARVVAGKTRWEVDPDPVIDEERTDEPESSPAESAPTPAPSPSPQPIPPVAKIRTEERLFLPGRKNPVLFQRDAPALFLLQRIRDETHRFAITFHRETRRRETLQSVLDQIDGVGPARRRALLRHFGSVAALRAATAEQIADAPGINRALAERIHGALNPVSNGSD